MQLTLRINVFSCNLLIFILLEDCTDCFGTQKKDEPNDKEKKEEEETSASVHQSIIESWDWGQQPGKFVIRIWLLKISLQPTFKLPVCPSAPLVILHLLFIFLVFSKSGN